MSKNEAVEALLEQVGRHISLANLLLENAKYDYCLYMWHLVLEKTLKAIAIHKSLNVEYIHVLGRLAENAQISLDGEEKQQLKEITEFNIEARYDDFKSSFYHKATKEYAYYWSEKCKYFYNKFIAYYADHR